MFETFTAGMMLIVFLVPGYVWRTVEGQFVYLDRRLEWEKFALGLLCRSTFVHLPIAPWTYQAWLANLHETQPALTAVLIFALLFIQPTLLGLLAGISQQNGLFRWLILKSRLSTFEQHKIPSAWDRVFSNITTKWVIVRLKNGGRIYGYLGTNSYASSDPQERDLYISHVVHPAKDRFVFAKDTAGIYLRGDEIVSIEMLEPPSAGNSQP